MDFYSWKDLGGQQPRLSTFANGLNLIRISPGGLLGPLEDNADGILDQKEGSYVLLSWLFHFTDETQRS